MGDHFLQWINIVDFKCFHNFEAKDFKRVNLISGKNNVGKTAFMEACFINSRTLNNNSFTDSVFQIKFSREKLNFCNNQDIDPKTYLDSTQLYFSISNLRKTGFRYVGDDAVKEYVFTINENISIVNKNDLSLDNTNSNINFIDNYGFSDKRLARYYTFIQAKDHESKLNDMIRNFDSSIDSFKVIGDKPQCKFQGEYIDITEFGDGLKHYISIICALYASENGQLFIDEIDNGIHYTQLKKIWKLIFEISKEVNCQVFATTHSKECIESYARVAKKLENQEIAFIELGKNKNNEIKAITMDYDRLQNEMENTNEVRGW